MSDDQFDFDDMSDDEVVAMASILDILHKGGPAAEFLLSDCDDDLCKELLEADAELETELNARGLDAQNQ